MHNLRGAAGGNTDHPRGGRGRHQECWTDALFSESTLQFLPATRSADLARVPQVTTRRRGYTDASSTRRVRALASPMEARHRMTLWGSVDTHWIAVHQVTGDGRHLFFSGRFRLPKTVCWICQNASSSQSPAVVASVVPRFITFGTTQFHRFGTTQRRPRWLRTNGVFGSGHACRELFVVSQIRRVQIRRRQTR
jgi:hypothetical protein